MTTRRSLNKLEKKAHTSLHDTVEVVEGDCEEVCFTRDRLGKKQRVQPED